MDAKLYAEHAAFVPELTARLLEIAQLKPEESVLDLGCGDGVLTERLAKTQSKVVGIDNQDDMVAAAKARGVDARLMSIYDLDAGQYDVVLTNAVLHWVDMDIAVLNKIKNSLNDGGRFVGEFGAFMNVSEIMGIVMTSMLHHGFTIQEIKAIRPFYFPTDSAWRTLLEEAGFKVDLIESEARVTRLPGTVSDWARTFLSRYIKGTKEESILRDLDSVSCLISANEFGEFHANYRRLRFSAHK